MKEEKTNGGEKSIINKQNPYDEEEHSAEIYDQEEATVADVKFILELLERHECGHVLDPE